MEQKKLFIGENYKKKKCVRVNNNEYHEESKLLHTI